MRWFIIAFIFIAAIAFCLWMYYEEASNKSEISNLKSQLDNIIKTYNEDTNKLHKDINDISATRDKYRNELFQIKAELINAKEQIEKMKGCKVVNNTDNSKHTYSKKRGRPKKL